jgi:hypothetical protein
VMHENREEKNDRQRNADKPEQRASSKTHVSLLYDGVLRPHGKKVPAWELRKAKIAQAPPSELPLRVFQLAT